MTDAAYATSAIAARRRAPTRHVVRRMPPGARGPGALLDGFVAVVPDAAGRVCPAKDAPVRAELA